MATVLSSCTEPRCGATFTTTAAHVAHLRRTGHVGQRPEWATPAPDPRESYDVAAADERAEAERAFADWIAR